MLSVAWRNEWIFNVIHECFGPGASSGSKIPVSESPARTAKIRGGTESMAFQNILEKVVTTDDSARGVLVGI